MTSVVYCMRIPPSTDTPYQILKPQYDLGASRQLVNKLAASDRPHKVKSSSVIDMSLHERDAILKLATTEYQTLPILRYARFHHNVVFDVINEI